MALELPLVHDARRVMWIPAAEVYSEGLVFTVVMRGRRDAGHGTETGPGTWRLTIEFSDGRSATSYGLGMYSDMYTFGPGPDGGVRAVTRVGGASIGKAAGRDAAPTTPQQPSLRAHAGSGHRRDWRQQYWLWPLPPPGELRFACEWPAIQLKRTAANIDAGVVLAGARRARPIWAAAGPRGPGVR